MDHHVLGLLQVDIVEDIRLMNDHAIKCPPPRKTGIIILGGGRLQCCACTPNVSSSRSAFGSSGCLLDTHQPDFPAALMPGLPKHHVCNANLMRNGADFAVYINTAQEFDGCGGTLA